jgi:glycosyltransferase A (GT-A) superfamily protein (DUF2064 family)
VSARVLIVAKAPVPGLAKTRLAAAVGDHAAADLAAAALLDSLDAVEAVTTSKTRLVALAGDLGAAVHGDEIAARFASWQVVEQQGASFSDRLVCAHHDAAAVFGGGAALVQIGTDTPQITPRDLDALGAAVDPRRSDGCELVLGPATDGGWWGLATQSEGYVDAMTDVPMSQPDTCDLTQAALEASGARVCRVHALTDVDTVDDAFRVAAAAPSTRFAQLLGRVVQGAAR